MLASCSSLWPFSTLGWPDVSAEDFKRFYPTSVLETGYIPFSTIYVPKLF